MTSRFLWAFTGAAGLLAAPALAQAPLGAKPAAALPAPRLSYSLSAGAAFAGRFGSATYLSPQLNYQLSNRLRVFGGLTYLHTLPGAAFAPAEAGTRAGRLPGASRYLLHGGGSYALSPRLLLTGTAWKDLTPGLPASRYVVNPYAGFNPLGSGVDLRADYHVTENFSISGGLGVRQGTSAAGLGIGPGAWQGY